MFGWDFPPKSSGGLGVACQGLSHCIADRGTDIRFVLPRSQPIDSHLSFIFALGEDFLFDLPFVLNPYSASGLKKFKGEKIESLHDGIFAIIRAYADASARIAEKELFDLIHAHDWLSYLAGVRAKEISGKPLILHVHATSFDQAGGDEVDGRIFEIEKHAFAKADKIIAVSEFTKKMVVEKFGVDPSKVEAVHNGIDPQIPYEIEDRKFFPGKKVVLFLGRVTIQKGPDYFIDTAKRVLEHNPDVIFIMAGEGDMLGQMIKRAAELGISDKVVFTGAIWGKERDFFYRRADLFVMPSVSEPFGLVPLEALLYGDTPVLISKQSGVSEVLRHALKVDFWDVDEMTNKILAVLEHKSLSETLKVNGKDEALSNTWHKAADKCISIYRKLVSK